MYQLKWANQREWASEDSLSPSETSNTRPAVRYCLVAEWEEHCVECAIPECYSSCPVYERRKDGACARFQYGIVANRRFKGNYNFGADIRFKKWAKIEADLSRAFPAIRMPHLLFDLFYRRAPGFFRKFIRGIGVRLFFGNKLDLDAFIIECYNPAGEKVTLFVEYFIVQHGVRHTRFRRSVILDPGHNNHAIPFVAFNMQRLEGYLYLYPEAVDRRLIFTWLDFVKFKTIPDSGARAVGGLTGRKIKCVAWDLDNTLWEGILEEGVQVRLKSGVKELIRELDKKGIIQTIVSKNNFDDASEEIRRLGLKEYFLYPAINWEQKSKNLRKLSDQLNIDLDSFAVIDDSAFEREEISGFLPQVRTYTEMEITKILQYPEFDASGDTFGSNRRIAYLEEIERKKRLGAFEGDYDDFLRYCEMKIRLSDLRQESELLRCWELVQRSNQLNISGRRYSLPEFKKLVKDEPVWVIAVKCEDRFGNYGTIGFCGIRFYSGVPQVVDLVFSCRIAQKKVEHAFIEEISNLLYERGFRELRFEVIFTEKNKPLRRVFESLPCEVIKNEAGGALLRLKLGNDRTDTQDVAVAVDESLMAELDLRIVTVN